MAHEAARLARREPGEPRDRVVASIPWKYPA
jgi:hypothetical protein